MTFILFDGLITGRAVWPHNYGLTLNSFGCKIEVGGLGDGLACSTSKHIFTSFVLKRVSRFDDGSNLMANHFLPKVSPSSKDPMIDLF